MRQFLQSHDGSFKMVSSKKMFMTSFYNHLLHSYNSVTFMQSQEVVFLMLASFIGKGTVIIQLKKRFKVISISNAYCIINYLCQIQTKVKPIYNHHLGTPQKVAFEQRWSVFGGFSIKIVIKVILVGLSLAFVDRRPLFRGGHQDRFKSTCLYDLL